MNWIKTYRGLCAVALLHITMRGAAALPDLRTCLASATIESDAASIDNCRERLPEFGVDHSPAALNALGNAYLNAHQPRKAADVYRAALAAVSASGRDYALLAVNLALTLADSDPEATIVWLGKAVAADPRFAEARVNLALSLSAQRTNSAPDLTAAQAHLQRALESVSGAGGPRASRLKARIHLYLGNLLFDRVYAEITGEADSVPRDRRPRLYAPATAGASPTSAVRGRYQSLGPTAAGPVMGVDGSDARLLDCESYDCILNLVSTKGSSMSSAAAGGRGLAALGGEAGDRDPAVSARADRSVPSADWPFQQERARRARLVAESARFRPVRDQYVEAIRLDPWLTDVRINDGNLLRETNRLEAAAERYRGAFCRDNADFVALSNLGQTLFQLGRCDDAYRTLAQVRRLRSVFLPGEDENFGSHFLTSEPLCKSRIADNSRIRLTSMSRLSSETCGRTISDLTFWRTGVALGPFEILDAGSGAPVGAPERGAARIGNSEGSGIIDRTAVRIIATRFTRDPEARILAHFGGGVIVSREADSALIATAYHILTFPGCVSTPAQNADDAVQSEADAIRVQFLADGLIEREGRIIWRAIGPGTTADLALLRVVDLPGAIPAAPLGRPGELEIGAPLRMLSWSSTGERRTIASLYRGVIDRLRRLVISDQGFRPGDSGAPIFGPDGAVVGLVAGAEWNDAGTGRTGGEAISIQPIADTLRRLRAGACLAEDP